MSTPYIGVASLTDRSQAETLVQIFPGTTARKFQVGVQVSSATIHGQPANHPNRSVSLKQIPRIFLEDPRAMNVVHFYSLNPDDTIRYRRDLQIVMDAAGQNCHAIQLNNRWVSPNIVEEFYEEFPETEIILQVDERACRELAYDPSAVADRIADWYGGVADYAFFDWSCGYGREIQPKRLLPYLEALSARATGMKLAGAGGLCAATVDVLRPILERFPYFSWDAQSKLRTADDRLDLKEAERFLGTSLALDAQVRAFGAEAH